MPPSYWKTISDSEQTFTDLSWAEIETLDFTAPAQGDYLIMVSFQIVATNASNFNITFRAQLDDTTTIMEGVYKNVNTSRTFEYKTEATFYLAQDLASGAHYVDVDAYVEGGSTGYISYVKIIVIRLDDWLSTSGMYGYAESESSTSIGDTDTQLVSLDFTPDQADDCLVLFTSSPTIASTSYSVAVHGDYDGASEVLPVKNSEETGETYVTFEAMGTADRHAFTWGGIIAIPASSKTLVIYGRRSGTATCDSIRDRILVIRLGAMGSNVESDEVTTNASTTGQWTNKGTLTFTPGSTQDYLILGGMCIKPDSGTYPSHARLEHSTGTATGTIGQTNVDSKDSSGWADDFPLFTAHIKELATTQQIFETQFGYANSSGTTYGKASLLVAIPLEEGGATPHTQTVTADLLLQKTQTGNLTADVLLLKALVANLPADLYLQKEFLASLPADLLLKLIQTATLTADLLLQKTMTTSVTADVILGTGGLISLLADVLLQKSIEASITADLLLQTTHSTTLPADLLLKAIQTSSLTADVLLKALGVSVYVTADMIIGSVGIPHTITLTADCILWSGMGYTQGAAPFTRGSSLYSQNAPIYQRRN